MLDLNITGMCKGVPVCPIEGNGEINGVLGFNLHFYTKVEFNLRIETQDTQHFAPIRA